MINKEKIKLYTEDDVKKIVSRFASTYSPGACQWESENDVLKDIQNGFTPLEIISEGEDFYKEDEVYIEDCGFKDGRYELVLVPVKYFKGFTY